MVFTRIALVGVNMSELVAVSMSLTFRIFLRTASGSFFVSQEMLNLVRSEVPFLRFGFVIRHIIDESSPLKEYSDEDLQMGDASFMLSVSGMERTSMHPVFYKRVFVFAFYPVIFLM